MDGAGTKFLTVGGYRVSKENWEIYATMKKKAGKGKLPPHIKCVERDENNYTFFISFSENLTYDRQNMMVDACMQEYRDYVLHAQWTTTNKLMVNLRKSRRDIDPSTRREARCDIPAIAEALFLRFQ